MTFTDRDVAVLFGSTAELLARVDRLERMLIEKKLASSMELSAGLLKNQILAKQDELERRARLREPVNPD